MAQVGIVRIKKLVDGLLQFVKDDYDYKNGMSGESTETVANSDTDKQKYVLSLSGTEGRGFISGAGYTDKIIDFDDNILNSVLNFYTDNVEDYLTNGVILTYDSNTLIFESETAGTEFDAIEFRNEQEESFLYRCFDDDDVADNIDYKELAVEIFTREETDRNKVETRLLFDVDRASMPTIHIREPAKGKGKQDGIGNVDESFYENSDSGFAETRRRSFDSQYELMITSMNRHEVIIVEEVMLALFIGAQDSLMLEEPFYNISLSVKELMANNELVPNPIFIKSIGLQMSYDKKYPDISNNKILNKILFDQKILS